LVKKEKAKKQCCCVGGEFLLFCTPPPKKTISGIFLFQKTSFFSVQSVAFSKIYINFCDIIIVIIIISLGGKN
jgi:hypothetical protein